MAQGIPIPLPDYGVQLMSERKYAEAAKVFEGALRREPGNPRYHDKLGICYFWLDRIEEAITQHKNAVELEPEDPMYVFNLGVTFSNADRPREAIPCFKKTISLEPEIIGVAYLYLGDAYRDIGETVKAGMQYQLATQRDKHLLKAYMRLFDMYYFFGESERALDYLLEGYVNHAGLDCKPNDAKALSGLMSEISELFVENISLASATEVTNQLLKQRLEALKRSTVAKESIASKEEELSSDNKVLLASVAGIVKSDSDKVVNHDLSNRLLYARES